MLMRWVAAYVVAAVVFCVLDALWLGVFAVDFYREQLGPLLAQPPRWDAAVAFYAVYLVGLIAFGVRPAWQSGRLGDALGWGGGFGFFTYYTYDMTNLATLNGWPPAMVAVDVVWGMLLNASAAGAAFAVTRRGTAALPRMEALR
jgi:uncharacterized membrane protein